MLISIKKSCLDNNFDYSKPIDKNKFLVNYQLNYDVGCYAAMRYFKLFEDVGLLIDCDDVFMVNIEYLKLNNFDVKGVKFPQPKTQVSYSFSCLVSIWSSMNLVNRSNRLKKLARRIDLKSPTRASREIEINPIFETSEKKKV